MISNKIIKVINNCKILNQKQMSNPSEMILISKQHYNYVIQLVRKLGNTLEKALNTHQKETYKQLTQRWYTINQSLDHLYKNITKQYESLETQICVLKSQNITLSNALQTSKQQTLEHEASIVNLRSQLTKQGLQNSQIKDYLKKVKEVILNQKKTVDELNSKVSKYKKIKHELQEQLKQRDEKIKLLLAEKEDEVGDELDKQLAELESQMHQENNQNQ